jgi:lipopolysaccharide/colanic/teichoic acid biosynthesis glycosyltransferase
MNAVIEMPAAWIELWAVFLLPFFEKTRYSLFDSSFCYPAKAHIGGMETFWWTDVVRCPQRKCSVAEQLMMTEADGFLYPFLKSLTDKVVSFFVLVLFSPVIMAIVPAMAVSMLLIPRDRGPLFYRERRISRGQEFHVLKFRVLRQEVVARMQREGKHARIYENDISNLTWAGRYLLKKWYFDELPQLFNILEGDMSLVGPRPWPVHMVNAQIERGLVYRKLIHAGWTGPAQLQKGQPTREKSEKLDLEYLTRCRTLPIWQLWLYDIRLLCQTLKVMLQGQGLKY